MRPSSVAASAFATIFTFCVCSVAHAQTTPSCESLATLTLPHATVTLATSVEAHGFTRPSAVAGVPGLSNSVAFCRVTVTSKPSTDSDIAIEAWLPASGWNGKFLAVGNGGWAGTINYGLLNDGLTRGYAAAGTDTGHVGASGAFAFGHPEKLIDYAYRSEHELAVIGKAIVAAYYGATPRLSLWNGCSAGGRQGITEAWRYPEDFDAIIAGAAGNYQMRMHVARVALNVFAHRSVDSYVPPEKYPAIHHAVVSACDELDGLKDGLIADPPACRFDARVLACSGAETPNCLNGAQVDTVNAMFAPVKHPKTGEPIINALVQPGSELGWAILAGPQPLNIAQDGLKYIAFNYPAWDWRHFNPAIDIDRALAASGSWDVTSADLRPFFGRGGKLLMYHGWADPQVTPLNSVAYFNDVLQTTGAASQSKSIELYLSPGMNHCRGGEGFDTFDVIAAMEQWIATGKAPAQIPSSHLTSGVVARTRPLCAYPQIARYTGSGSIDDAANFTCERPTHDFERQQSR
jgi:feruloyl esterase